MKIRLLFDHRSTRLPHQDLMCTFSGSCNALFSFVNLPELRQQAAFHITIVHSGYLSQIVQKET